jgi:hypothetical protein
MATGARLRPPQARIDVETALSPNEWLLRFACFRRVFSQNRESHPRFRGDMPLGILLRAILALQPLLERVDLDARRH